MIMIDNFTKPQCTILLKNVNIVSSASEFRNVCDIIIVVFIIVTIRHERIIVMFNIENIAGALYKVMRCLDMLVNEVSR